MGASRSTTEDAEGAENFSFSGYYVFTVVSFVRLQTWPPALLQTGPAKLARVNGCRYHSVSDPRCGWAYAPTITLKNASAWR